MDFAPLATQVLSVSSAADDKELVRQAIDIVDLVRSYHLDLRRQGRMHVALCPWHDDTRPSLQVNPERQSFKCWVCDIGGDVFTFVMRMEGVEFREALEMLAERAGIQLRRPQAPGAPASREPASPKRQLYQAMAWAERRYHECLLKSPAAEPARRYLEERGITSDSIRRFHLGFAPDRWGWIGEQTRQSGAGFSDQVLAAVGVLAPRTSGGGYYDRFKGRLLFPIRDAQGRPVGLGGRSLPEIDSVSPAKYVNSPETPLFSKSNLLYGLDLARDAIRESRTAVVTEGYTDCIVAHQCGFQNSVAVLGTALGERHLRLLPNFADRIVLVLDGDEAGQRRANEVLSLFVAQQVDLWIVTLPAGMDPCDFLQQQGPDAFRELLDHQAVDALDHAFRTATQGLDVQREIGRAEQALEHLVGIVAAAPRLSASTTHQTRFREEKILQRLAARFRVDEGMVRQRLTSLRRAAQRRNVHRPRPETRPAGGPRNEQQPIGTVDAWHRELLELLIQHPETAAQARQQLAPERLTSGPARRIYQACCRLADADVVPTFDRLMLEFDEPELKSLLVELDERGRAKACADPAALLSQLIRSYYHQELQRDASRDRSTLREGQLDDGQQLTLLEKVVRQQRNRQGLTDPTDG